MVTVIKGRVTNFWDNLLCEVGEPFISKIIGIIIKKF